MFEGVRDDAEGEGTQGKGYTDVTVREAVEWTMSKDTEFTYIDVRSTEEHEKLATVRYGMVRAVRCGAVRYGTIKPPSAVCARLIVGWFRGGLRLKEAKKKRRKRCFFCCVRWSCLCAPQQIEELDMGQCIAVLAPRDTSIANDSSSVLARHDEEVSRGGERRFFLQPAARARPTEK